MINCYVLNQDDLVLNCDLAGEFPLYLYWPQNKSTLLYSKSITGLLSDQRVPKPLKVSNEGISFLLQSGVVPPPKTDISLILFSSSNSKDTFNIFF